MNQPIDEISCCNCTTCQGYIKGLEKRVEELEAKVESLTRTLDLWQELTGIEIVASPLEEVEL